MTTNYTWILNENLDQIEVESAEEEYEYSNGLGWHETADGLEWDQLDRCPVVENGAGRLLPARRLIPTIKSGADRRRYIYVRKVRKDQTKFAILSV